MRSTPHHQRIGAGVRQVQADLDDLVLGLGMRLNANTGRGGYPGNCTVTATYELKEEGVLNGVYESVTDQSTLANICQHTYFNLDGRPDILGHDLMIAADHYLPTTPDFTPSGEIRPVDGTPMDFRKARRDNQRIGRDCT